ncbi:MAG: glycosyltransferase family 1 protein [Anaerolineae bacterium]|nr:glycosyltransferase family 4 protein [Anaerolineae bacterium]MDW8068965.1 glycosyltransferase family 1 protein [Anaerolineae bacterium]
MRVHLFADSLQENWPSMDRYARSLFRALKEVAPEIDFRLLVPPNPPLGLAGRLFVLWRILAYPLWARRHRAAEVYHILDHSYGHLLLALDGGRAVVTVHDVAPFFFPGRRWGLSRLAWEVAWRGTQRAAHWIAISDFTHSELRARAGQNPPPISRIYYGVEAHFRPLSKHEQGGWRAKWGARDSRIVLHVGHCQPRKNLERLLTALALLTRGGMDFQFFQVGGIFTAPQQGLIERLGLRERVYQINRLSDDTQLVGLYNIADVLVLPSLYEGFGFPALEAMACGTPVVVSNVASLPEVVEDAGLLIDPHDPQAIAEAITRVLSDPALAEELRQRGLERAKMFTWEKTARETLKVYQELLEGIR